MSTKTTLRAMILVSLVVYLFVGALIYAFDLNVRRSVHVCPEGVTQPSSQVVNFKGTPQPSRLPNCPSQTESVESEVSTAIVTTLAWPLLVLLRTGIGPELMKLYSGFTPSQRIEALPSSGQ